MILAKKFLLDSPRTLTSLDSHKVIFIKNEAVLLCITMRERERIFAATI